MTSSPLTASVHARPSVGRNHSRGALLARAIAAVCLLAAFVVPATAFAVNPIVVFPDAALNSAVHTQMGIPLATPIHASDLTTLTTLSAPSAGVTHLDGLEWATHLQSLNLYNNDITTITALAACTALSEVNIDTNHISDFTPLAGPSHLHWFKAGSNPATSLAGIENQADLQYVDVQYSQIASLGPLANHPILQTAYLYNNNIADLTPLKSDPQLKNLSLGSNSSLADVSALSTMTTLSFLEFSYDHALTDISPLAGLTNLTTLGLYDCTGVTDVSAVANMTKLNFLNLSSCQVWDISPLRNIAGLTPGTIKLDNMWLDLTPRSDASQTVSGLISKGYAVTYLPQRTGGAIVGVVRDSRTGGLLVGVTAKLTNGPGTSSGTSGAYKIGLAQPGMRTLTFTKPNYSVVATTFDLDPGATSTVSVSLVPTQLTPTVKRSPSSSSLTYARKKGVAKFTLRATVTDARGVVVSSPIWLQQSTNGRTWSTLKKLTTSSAGSASLTISAHKKGTAYYRWYSQNTSADKYVKTPAQKVRVK